ncbi:hypothetical protein [Paraburkholderia unamae]|uniref:Uncharacterized protein n=1 Tax=Paraburkholderia unamae TaxID=219649 RepID=A0ACC6RGY1_9BURK
MTDEEVEEEWLRTATAGRLLGATAGVYAAWLDEDIFPVARKRELMKVFQKMLAEAELRGSWRA